MTVDAAARPRAVTFTQDARTLNRAFRESAQSMSADTRCRDVAGLLPAVIPELSVNDLPIRAGPSRSRPATPIRGAAVLATLFLAVPPAATPPVQARACPARAELEAELLTVGLTQSVRPRGIRTPRGGITWAVIPGGPARAECPGPSALAITGIVALLAAQRTAEAKHIT
jgi:hypothetical protein